MSNAFSDHQSEEVAEKPLEVKKDSFVSFLKELPFLIIAALIIAYLIKAFVVQPFYIPSGSMEPTLIPGDRVLVSKFSYHFSDPEPSDIIVFQAPGDNRDFIKRVVAVGGQTVEIRDGQLFVDGEPVSETYKTIAHSSLNLKPREVPEGQVFVMGDNRPNSMDSRAFGSLTKDSIVGRAFIIYWPIDRAKLTG